MRRRLRSAVRVGLCLLGAGLLVFCWQRRGLELEAPPTLPPSSAAPPAEAAEEPEAPSLSLPSGAPVGIGCDEAKQVSAYVRRELAAPAIVPLPGELAELWSGLLDPHGLWSAPPDSPLREALKAASESLLLSLDRGAPGCPGAERVARAFEPWLVELAAVYDAAFDAARSAGPRSASEVYGLAAEPIFEEDPVTRSGHELARELGQRLGAFVARFPAEASLAERARSRFFPSGQQLLQDIALLSALRAYVMLVDPHADFAPFDAEWALYAGDSTLDAGSPLWGEVARTPLGARVVDDPAPPLQLDDLVLSIDGLSLAGASLDQIEQAARSGAPGSEPSLKVLRQGEPRLLVLSLVEQDLPPEPGLQAERIADGAGGSVVRIDIPDVGDWLGRDLAELLEQQAPGASAVLLDLRGNGGGSLDAAVETLGLFVPGATLFPLIRRGAVSEVLQAPQPDQPYVGPLAVLLDGDTASAAEMIAGGIQAYARGPLIGARSFGKGCVQEYFDDVVPSGVLRLTTLQFVMPSGKPLQQIGLTPDLLLPLAPATERESQITRQPISFEGPDVRDRQVRSGPPWPRAKGEPGPCADPVVCTALKRLGQKTPFAFGVGAPNARAATGPARAGTR